MNSKTAIVFLADGFEECEGLLVIDLLRRAEVKVITASIMGRTQITSSHGIVLQADALAEDVDYDSADMLILPGGYHGTMKLAESSLVKRQCRRASDSRKYIAAICAAPSVLAGIGLLEGKDATCHPSFEDRMDGAVLTHADVSEAGNIITGRGLGAAIPFALKLVEKLADLETADRIAKAICYENRP